MPDSEKDASGDEIQAYLKTPLFRRRFRKAQNDMIRADERERIVKALRHHGHATDSTAFYEAADFIERRLNQ